MSMNESVYNAYKCPTHAYIYYILLLYVYSIQYTIQYTMPYSTLCMYIMMQHSR